MADPDKDQACAILSQEGHVWLSDQAFDWMAARYRLARHASPKLAGAHATPQTYETIILSRLDESLAESTPYGWSFPPMHWLAFRSVVVASLEKWPLGTPGLQHDLFG